MECCLLPGPGRRKKIGNGKLDIGKLVNRETQKEFQERAKDLIQQHPIENVEQHWENMRDGLIKAAEEIIGKQKPEKRKEWITDEIILMFEERRKLKNNETEEGKTAYRVLRNKINRKLKQVKERFLEDRCKEVGDLLKKGNLELAYKTVKRFFSGGQRIRCNALIREDNKMVYNHEDIALTWKEYLEKLYGGNVQDDMIESEDEVDKDELGDSIVRSEFDQALQALKHGKAPGIDSLPAEIIKAGGTEIKDKLYKLICQIYGTGELPEDFRKCIIVPLTYKMT
ncbi:uncharacterized protein LOC126204053 [Schistocerca nitens]|uniref:uncharacterized protein LOC126204053 n=1 Tax=Schistocerca nitens TaxID=7011 RepID=UPI002117A20F|nr:uncharacterized protein LOC126204053 [Schistocerca nitens]